MLVTVSFRALEAEKLNEQAAVANPEEVVSMVEMWVSISLSLSLHFHYTEKPCYNVPS